MGVRGSDTAEIILDSVRVPAQNILGDPAKGFKQFLYTLDGGRISIAALSVGIAQAALDASLSHAKKKSNFGQTLSSFQAIQFKLADMAMQIELARQMVWKAAWLKDHGKPFTKEAAYAKLFASEMATKKVLMLFKFTGNRLYERMWCRTAVRDAKLMEIGEGTSEIQRLVIARQLLA
ncbi:hypothetical protein BsIDN1_35230 [Bacillus safensis]|uniref:Acyl-CoA dehydrogenase/oxidase C-terminal domain-containing protein n=1 Tax=Bacillus safensis TaxID=561879 RepID=A0A5S9MAK9_BACIA|nr:hypothetical protein BsIDN1_35230 [Bacillus safensis]